MRRTTGGIVHCRIGTEHDLRARSGLLGKPVEQQVQRSLRLRRGRLEAARQGTTERRPAPGDEHERGHDAPVRASTRKVTPQRGDLNPPECQARTGPAVAHVPDRVPKVSPTYRSHAVHHEPGQHRGPHTVR